jgi:uncharacterized membrane protein
MGLRFAGPSKGIAKRGLSRGSQWRGGGGGTDVCRRAQQFPLLGWQFLVLGSLAVLVVAISMGFEFNPAWLVLPFAELGLLVVAMAFRCLERHAGDYECMIVLGDQVVIERGDRGGVSRFEFNRDWAQVVFREPRGKERGRLALRSNGNEVECGIHRTSEQRAAVARRLQKYLRIR